MFLKPGLYTNLSEDQYHASDGISSHGLNTIARSPLHYWAAYLNPEKSSKKETPALKIGSAIHRAILEPDKFESMYIREPQITDYKGVLDKLDDYKEACKARGLPMSGTKDVLKARIKAFLSTQELPTASFWDELEPQIVGSRIPLARHEYKACRAISYRVHKHPCASEIFKIGTPEVSIYWKDLDTDVLCRGRIDWITESGHTPYIVDIKSTQNANPESFQRDVFKYGYHIQAAMYWDGLLTLGYSPDSFVFSAWEKRPPYATALYFMTDEVLEAGRNEYKKLLKVYAKCLETDNWPGYSNNIEPLILPEWYGKQDTVIEESEDWLADL
jgi:exodeoxyribonuclease VIII